MSGLRCRFWPATDQTLGTEANRVEDSRVPGVKTAGGRAKTYVDLDPFKGSATEGARRLGVSRTTVFLLRKRPGRGGGAPAPRKR